MENYASDSGICSDDCYCENTYGSDHFLSQDLQFQTLFDELIILQIHNGCDIRGGYTNPKIFCFDGRSSFYSKMKDALITCSNCNLKWSIEDKRLDNIELVNEYIKVNNFENNFHDILNGNKKGIIKSNGIPFNNFLKKLNDYEFEFLDYIPKNKKKKNTIINPKIKELDLFDKNYIHLDLNIDYEYQNKLIICNEKGYCPLCGGELI